MSMIAALIEPYKSNPLQLLGLVIWREARGESLEAKRAVASVIANRVALAPAQGFARSVSGNILKPWAFSSFMEGDPNAARYPLANEPAWLDSLAAARAVGPDLSCGAVFYFSPPLVAPPHCWGAVELSAAIGRLRFYRIAAPTIAV